MIIAIKHQDAFVTGYSNIFCLPRVTTDPKKALRFHSYQEANNYYQKYLTAWICTFVGVDPLPEVSVPTPPSIPTEAEEAEFRKEQHEFYGAGRYNPRED